MSQLGCVWYSSLPGVSFPLMCVSETLRVWKWVNFDVQCNGLEKSQFVTFCCMHCCIRVLKWVNFQCKTQGSWNESISDIFAVIVTAGVWKGVNLGWKCHVCRSSQSRCPHTVLDEVQRLMLKAGMTFCRPISPSCPMQGVTFLEVGLPVLCQVMWMGWWVRHDEDVSR